MTVLEIAHSKSANEIHTLLMTLAVARTSSSIDSSTSDTGGTMNEIKTYTQTHRTRLVHPLLGYDASAIALTFVPADDSSYTYHHLRHDLFDTVAQRGVTPVSRYVAPSAHLTIARWINGAKM